MARQALNGSYVTLMVLDWQQMGFPDQGYRIGDPSESLRSTRVMSEREQEYHRSHLQGTQAA